MSRLSLWFGAAVLLAFCGATQARTEVAVSTGSFNRFTFQMPFNEVVFPPNTQLAHKPVAMDGNKTLLISLEASVTEPVQMVVQLQGGNVIDFLLVPGANVGAEWMQPSRIASHNAPHPQVDVLVDLFSAVLANPNAPPAGFHERPVPDATRIKGLVADFIGNYANRNYRILVMHLRAQRPNPIVPQDLYVKGVAAVYIDGDSVGPQVAPLAIVLKAK